MSAPIAITSPTHFTSVLASTRILVVNFHAESSGPSKTIAPLYAQLSTQLSRAGALSFCTVNTAQQPEVTRTYNISAVPSFMIFKAGRETKRIRGADFQGLDQAVRLLAREANKADDDGGAAEGSGSGGAAVGGAGWSGASAPRGYVDVTSSIEVQGLDFLNLDPEVGDKRTIFETPKPSALGSKGKQTVVPEGPKDWIESDTDEQLMLFIPFQSTLKLHSLHITSVLPTTSADEDVDVMRPKTLKFYTNRSTILGFDEADDTLAVQEIVVAATDWDEKTATAKVELRFVKFQNISSLVVFVVDGEGDGQKTRIDRLRLFGETGEKRALGKLEKIGDEQGE